MVPRLPYRCLSCGAEMHVGIVRLPGGIDMEVAGKMGDQWEMSGILEMIRVW